MPTLGETRLTVHFRAHSDRCPWSLMIRTTDDRGIPTLRMLRHGVVDLKDQDLVGIEALAQALLVAADQQA
jgi:hypothetical protein